MSSKVAPRILETATKVFSITGYYGTSLEEIASHAGVHEAYAEG
jgi:AcrR family transcriptional regulator